MIRDGKAVIIDWMNASIGNPEADLAEYVVMIRFAILPSYLPNELNVYFNSNRESIIKVFIDEYTSLSGITNDEVDAWIIPIAARKLSADAISEEEKTLLVNEIRIRLKERIVLS
jgi:aminoglycoside phosphotransferase (APT) family kinase protein